MNFNSELIQTVESLINAGCHYRLDDLAGYYAADLQIVMLQPDGSTTVFDYAQNMAFFQNMRDSGAPPLNTDATFNYAQEQEGVGYVIVTRRMNLGAGEQNIVFTLMLRKEEGGWRVFREHAVMQAT